MPRRAVRGPEWRAMKAAPATPRDPSARPASLSASPGSASAAFGTALALTALGVALLLAAGWLLLATVPGALDAERAFTAAADCPAVRASAECRHAVTAAVTSVAADHKHRSTDYWLGLGHAREVPEALPGRLKTGPLNPGRADRPGAAGRAVAVPPRLRMDGRVPVFAAVRPGSVLHLTYWRGEIRYVDYQGLRQYTAADPRGGYRLPFAAALVLLSVGGACLRTAYGRARRRTAEPPAHEPLRLAVPLASVLLISCFAFTTPWVTGGVPTALLLMAAGAAPVLAGAAWLTRRHRRRIPDTIRVAPLAPRADECFPGRVLGEVPYSHEGFGYLVAGPGLLAATPDPAGRIARRPVPRTLTAVRVRLPYWTDPGPRPAPGSQVVECRDGATPVYVVTQPAYVSRVLGALDRVTPCACAPPATARTRWSPVRRGRRP
ncbi:hypothetical protein ABZX93_04175 [Streptomyces sp. NPDC006632]|uniref:hypothetical protein n=1 Tax=Streptomyces sp. NPDC006632 TaxID=3157182 RepID=UPI0033AACF58